MLFWTDDYSEPKKVNIERGKNGSNGSNWDLGAHRGTSAITDFDQPTLLIVNEEIVEDCIKDESICPVLGCTDPTAFNYNINADIDDGSCCYTGGCTDDGNQSWSPSPDPACNYDPAACYDDGSCCYDCGCMDPNACNYDASACFDDGSCSGVSGCMDSSASNYNPLATCDDGSCTYPWSCVPEGYSNESCPKETEISYPAVTSPIPIFWKQTQALAYFANPTHGLQNTDFTSKWFRQTANAFVNGGHPSNSNWKTDGTCWKNNGKIIPYNPNQANFYSDDVWTQKTRYTSIILKELLDVSQLSILNTSFSTSTNNASWSWIIDYLRDDLGFDGTNTGVLLANPGNWDTIMGAGVPNDFFANDITLSWYADLTSALYAASPWPNVQSALSGPHHQQTTQFGNAGDPWLISTDPNNPGYSSEVAQNGSMSFTSQDGNIITLQAGNAWPWFIEGQPVSFRLEIGGTEFCECSGWQDEGCVQDPNGEFITQVECENCPNCNCNPNLVSWDCINDNCVQAIANNGQFNDYTAANDPFGPYGSGYWQCQANCTTIISAQPCPPGQVWIGDSCVDEPSISSLPSPSPSSSSSYNTLGTVDDTDSLSSYMQPSPLKATSTTPLGITRGVVSCKESTICRPVFVLEKHMTVIRKGPTMPLLLEMYKWTDSADINTDSQVILESVFTGDYMPQTNTHFSSFMTTLNPNTKGTAFDDSDISIFFNTNKELKESGDYIVLPIDIVQV